MIKEVGAGLREEVIYIRNKEIKLKRKISSVLALVVLFCCLTAGCAGGNDAGKTAGDVGKSAADAGKTAGDVGKSAADAGKTAGDVGKSAADAGKTAGDAGKSAADAGKTADETVVRIGSLKGPTSMGLLFLMNGDDAGRYDFRMVTGADELLALMVRGELDIALIPANTASILYAKTQGAVSVIDVNTLGVLYMVSGDSSFRSIADLRGRTIYLTGKGTTPDHVLHNIMEKNGISEGEYTLEYKSEATEVAAVLAEDPGAVGLLPQPFVTAACAQNDALSVIFDMNEEWDKVQGQKMVTGVTVVRREFLDEHEKAVQQFLQAHAASVQALEDDTAAGAAYAVEAGIVAKERIAQKAIPECNITCVTGDEMKKMLSDYLGVLYELSPESVGGALPGEDFYYMP